MIPEDRIISPVMESNDYLNSLAFLPQLIFSPPNPKNKRLKTVD